ncbi:4-alpha-glucanotransferase [Brevibacillus laterosporus]|uniref:4-alpha-glucanotransferase n=1 Tax=Brevibacillus laterosporus TaxID=1465 RepID=A0A518V502_BRELA|nr:4-alpha-glucanotransferase [Brevibacillus laterosporus]
MDEFLFAPVLGGLWTHRDVVEDVFDIDDLLDAHEIMEVKAENTRRAQEAAKLQEGGVLG